MDSDSAHPEQLRDLDGGVLFDRVHHQRFAGSAGSVERSFRPAAELKCFTSQIDVENEIMDKLVHGEIAALLSGAQAILSETKRAMTLFAATSPLRTCGELSGSTRTAPRTEIIEAGGPLRELPGRPARFGYDRRRHLRSLSPCPKRRRPPPGRRAPLPPADAMPPTVNASELTRPSASASCSTMAHMREVNAAHSPTGRASACGSLCSSSQRSKRWPSARPRDSACDSARRTHP